MTTYYKQTDPQHNIRIPAELKARIAESAKAHNRSMNADIVARLEKSFEEQTVSSGMSLEDYKKAAQEVFKETVIAHMKQHDDRREQRDAELIHMQAAMIQKLKAELEALQKK